MKKQRIFSVEFKCQVVEDFLSGENCAAQLCRKYNICSSLLYHWKDQKPKSKSPEEMRKEADLKDRIEDICLEFPPYGYRRVTAALGYTHQGFKPGMGSGYHPALGYLPPN